MTIQFIPPGAALPANALALGPDCGGIHWNELAVRMRWNSG